MLQSYGFHGSIQDFNRRVEITTKAHLDTLGYRPSPDLVLDVARSPLHDEHLPRLFLEAPRSKRLARLRPEKFVKDGFYDPENDLETRDDGLLYKRPLLGRDTDKFHPEELRQVEFAQLRRDFPTVQAGALPMGDLGVSVESAVRSLNKLAGEGQIDVRSGGMTLAEWDRQAKLLAQNQRIPDSVELRRAVQTIADAQRQLNKWMRTDLPVTGEFNDDWLRALSNWFKSRDYFRKVAESQAKQAGFESVESYEKAWRAKQTSVKKHGASVHFLNAMPLRLFSAGDDPIGVFKSLFDYVTVEGATYNPFNPHFWNPSTPLHALTRSGGLLLRGIGGTVDEVKASAAAGTKFVAEWETAGFGGDQTLDEAHDKARKRFQENPSWLKIFLPDFDPESGGEKALDTLTNVALDLILLRKPRFTGERVRSGDLRAAKDSTYLRYASNWAYNDLKKHGRDGIGRASSRLEGGLGAKQLVTRAEPLIRNGKLTRERFQEHVEELYAYGSTTLPRIGGASVTASGSALGSLRTGKLPSKGKPGRAWDQARTSIRETADDLDSALRRSNFTGTDLAANFISGTRARFQHYVSGSRGFFDEKLPERVHDYVIREFGDASLANKWESAIVRAQATDNVQAILQVQRKLEGLYATKYPHRKGIDQDPFAPVLATEAPSVFRFPAGGEREFDGILGTLIGEARKGNAKLVTIAQYHARAILAGLPGSFPFAGMSLFWKHAIADTLRRATGEPGFLFGSTSGMRRAKREIDGLANTNPQMSRQLGGFRARAKLSETRWLLNRGGGAGQATTYRTGEKLGKSNYMEAAGGYLRRQLDDDALTAYRQSSGGLGLAPLVDLVLHNRTYRGMWKSARRNPASKQLSAEEYAELVFAKFRSVEDGLLAAGKNWDDALAVLRAHRGATVDRALGKFINNNRIDFEVKSGQVEMMGAFDRYSSWSIERIMTFNKWNRAELGDRTMYRTYDEFRKAGWPERAAFDAAVDIAERQVVYTMLDFANRLQIEQDLRWISYFATKHRLYWKWVLGTFSRHPGYAAAVHDFRDALNERGEIEFNLAGFDLKVPAARLVWVPGREYSEFSPLALAVGGFVTDPSIEGIAEAARGNFGNVLTRNDTVVKFGYKLASGTSTYGGALEGLDERTKAFLAYRINSYQTDFYREHGHYDTEANAVRKALWESLAGEYWRANMPLPVLPATGENEGQKLLRQFMALVDPAKRRKFLDQHPELGLYFGIYEDPTVYIHNKRYWEKYNHARDQRDAARAQIFRQAKEDGFTPELNARRLKADGEFNKLYEQLLLEDARTGGGLVADGKVVRPGHWGRQVKVDPLIDPRKRLKYLFPGLKPGEFDRIPGQVVKELRSELSRLRDTGFAATYGDEQEVKARIRQILEQIEVFQSFPSDALGEVQRKYQRQHVNSYWRENDQWYERLEKTPSSEKGVLYADFRAWKDSQDQSVTVDGVKFPSPIRMAWAMMDPATRKERLARLATAAWAHLADYEKELLLDRKMTKKQMSRAWAELEKALDQFRKENPGAKVFDEQILSSNPQSLVRQLNRDYPGFLLDYLASRKPKIDRFEQTVLYRDMGAAVRVEFNELVGVPAKLTAQAIRQHGSAQYYLGYWRRYVRDEARPKMSPSLRKELFLYDPDFLNTLPSR